MRVACKCLCLVLASSFAIILTGCNLSQFGEPSRASSVLPAISGKVHGGQQPISGAAIQIFAANTSVSKGASTALLSSPVLTNAGGGFSIGAGAYTCPTPGTLVYLVATGGNPGLPGNVNNTAIALMVVLGTCSSLSTDAFVTVNELTTVAAVEALAPFMADAAHVGSDAGNPGGLAGAFATAASMVNFATGQLQPAVAGVTQPTALLNTLADILAACVNSAGRTTPGLSTPCGVLLGYAGLGGSVDTLTAMRQIVQYPASDVAQLFGLVGAAVPFAPTLSSAPHDFTTSIGFALPGTGPYLLAIDSAQHIWIYSEVEDANNMAIPGPITVYDNSGVLLFKVQPGTGGLDAPVQIVADPFGNVWALNSNITLSKLGPNGGALSPSGGFPIPLLPPPSIYGSNTYFGGKYISIDPGGNLWAVNSGTTSNCFVEVNNAGSVITPSGNFCSVAGNAETALVATDGSGNAWFSGFQTISKANSSGALVAYGVNSNGCFDEYYDTLNPGSTVKEILAYAYSGEGIDLTLLYDRANNQLWGTTEVGVGALRSDGSQVFCDSRGANLPVIPFYDTFLGYGSAPGTTGELYISSSAIDGTGNLWFTTNGYATVGNQGGPVSTTSISGLNALSSSGGLITPYNAVAGVYGLRAGLGLGVVSEQGYMAVDAYGNIWMIVLYADGITTPTYSLVKVSGLAVPKNYQ